jgi:hypothetical protein
MRAVSTPAALSPGEMSVDEGQAASSSAGKSRPNKPRNLMNRRQIWTFVAAATTAATVILSNGDALAAEQFDGRWTLTLKCPKAPDGAKAYTHIFDVNVKDGMLDGDYVVPGQNNGHFHLNGPIRPDGSAYLHMSGETGQSEYTFGHPSPGVQALEQCL